MDRPKRQPEPCCPFIDRDDERCAQRFTLSHLREAFTYCLHHYRQCPVYQQLMREQMRDQPRPALNQGADPPAESTGEPLRGQPPRLPRERPHEQPATPPAPQPITLRGRTLDRFVERRHADNAAVPLRKTGA